MPDFPTAADYASHNAQTAEAKADQTKGQIDRLLNLLQAKGILTADEAESVRWEQNPDVLMYVPRHTKTGRNG